MIAKPFPTGNLLFHAKVAIFADVYMYSNLSTVAMDNVSGRWVELRTESHDTVEFVDAMSYIYDTGGNSTLKDWFAEWACCFFSEFNRHAAFGAALRQHGDLAYAVCRFFN